MRSTAVTVTASVVLALSLPERAPAADYTLPPGGWTVNVRDFGAKGDGKTDDTAAITKAFRTGNKSRGKFVVYFPNGTYLVSGVNTSYRNDLLHATLSFAGRKDPTVVVGESREKTIIKLRDSDPKFQNHSYPVLTVGRAGPSDFGHGVYSITVDVGAGNPGATGLQYHTSNNGSVVNVRVVSSDPEGAGKHGFDFGAPNPGPALAQHIEAEGFDIGIRMQFKGFNMVMEHVSLKHQRKFGVYSDDLPFAIRGLTSVNSVPVVHVATPLNYACLIEGKLVGENVPEGIAAIESPNGAALFVRDMEITGYGTAIRATAGQTTRYVPAGKISEFASHPPVTAAPASARTSLSLPIEDAPKLPWPKPDEWVSVTKFGAVSGDKQDDSSALQKAIDSGAVDLYFPNGEYNLSGTIHVRGKVRRIHGMSSRWEMRNTGSKPLFKIEDGESPVVVIERWKPQPNANDGVFIDQASKRTLVLRHGVFNNYVNSVRGGKVFIEDMTGKGRVFEGQRVWIRQLNPEGRGHGPANIINRGGDLWMLGIKTEGERTAIETTDGGRTELLGVNLYPHQGVHGTPAFICKDSQVSLSYSMDNGWTSPDAGYEEHLRLIENGRTTSVWRGDLYKRGGYLDRRGGAFVPLLVHRKADPAPAAAAQPPVPTGHTRGGLGRTAHFDSKAPRGQMKLLWSVNTDRNNGPPVVAGGTCYFGDKMGSFWAVDAKTGKRKWSVKPDEYTGSRGPHPAVGHGKVFYGTWGAMNARDAKTGRLIWQFRTDGGTWFGPAVTGDLVVFTSAEGMIYGVDAETGLERWWLRTPSAIASDVAAADGIGYVGLRRGLIAFEVATGRELWQVKTGASVPFPVVSDGVLYVAGDELRALDAKAGELRWKQDYFDEQAVRIAVADDEIYFGGPRVHGIYVLEAETGELKGDPIRFDDHGNRGRGTAMMAGPAVADGVLYYLQYGNWPTVLVDLKTRTKLYEGSPGGGFGSEPFLADGILYFSERGAVGAYR